MAKKTAFLLHYDMLENLKLLGNDVTVEVLTALSLHDQGMDIMPLSPQAQFAVNSYLPALNKARRRWETSVVNGGGTVDPDEPSKNLAEPNSNLGEPRDILAEASGGLGGGVLVPDLVLAPVLVPENSSGSSEPPSPATISDLETVQPPDETPPDKKTGKPKKPPLREREPENDQERVVKAYLENWDELHRRGVVKTAEPVMNRAQVGSLIKGLLKNQGLDIGRIISVVNKSASDPFVLQNGFSLGGILSASNVNKQLNGSTGPPSGYGQRSSTPPSLAGKNSLGAILKSIDGHPARGDLDEPFAEGGRA